MERISRIDFHLKFNVTTWLDCGYLIGIDMMAFKSEK